MPKVIYRCPRIVERLHARGFESIKSPGAAVANRCSQCELRTDQSLSFQPLERCVNGAGRDITLKSLLNFSQYPATVSVFTQPHNSEQYRLFKSTECFPHVAYIVGND